MPHKWGNGLCRGLKCRRLRAKTPLVLSCGVSICAFAGKTMKGGEERKVAEAVHGIHCRTGGSVDALRRRRDCADADTHAKGSA